MDIPFNKDELKKSAGKLQNGKGVGIDDFQAEFVKYAHDAHKCK